MAETTIEWTATRLPDGSVLPGYTFNPWQGCVRVSPACDHCYAATLANRFGVEWGPNARRKFQSNAYWSTPIQWNRQAEKTGIRRKVFCASMSDVFEELPRTHPDWGKMHGDRSALWEIIEKTSALDWLLLTKRPKAVSKLVPGRWMDEGFPTNVWLGTTVENQEWAEKRIPELLALPARVRFLSCEPLLGPVDLGRFHIGWMECPDCGTVRDPCPEIPLGAVCRCDPDEGKNCWFFGKMPTVGLHLHWVITGGESGHNARPTHPQWFRSLRDQCAAAGVPFHFKQHGAWADANAAQIIQSGPVTSRNGDVADWMLQQVSFADGRDAEVRTHSWTGNATDLMFNVGKKAAGRLLDGVEHNGFPEVING